MIYSLMFPLPLYLMEIRLAKSVLVSAFSIVANLFSMSSRNPLAVVMSSDIVPVNAYGMAFFMIIILMRFDLSHLSMSRFASAELVSVKGARQGTLNARSISMTPRTIMTFFCHDLKLVPLSIGIELMLEMMFGAELVTEKNI